MGGILALTQLDGILRSPGEFRSDRAAVEPDSAHDGDDLAGAELVQRAVGGADEAEELARTTRPVTRSGGR